MTTTGARRLAAALVEATAGDGDLPVATVVALAGGKATVRLAGANLPMPYLASYTPAVGHQVVLVRAGGRWIILGQLAGIPT